MFDKFSEQMTKSAQPVANMMEMNARMLELMSKQQTLLFTGFMDDSVKLVENLTTESELKGMLAAQSVFAESLRERVTGASKTTYTELTSISSKMMKGGLTTVDKPQTATAAASAPKATTASAPKKASTINIAKTATVKKAVAKKAPAQKPVATAKPKTATVVDKEVTSTTPKATAKPKTATVVDKEVTSIAPKAAATELKVANKPVAKTVTNVTPADVKASVEK